MEIGRLAIDLHGKNAIQQFDNMKMGLFGNWAI